MHAPNTISHLGKDAALSALQVIAVLEAMDHRKAWVLILGRTPEGFAYVSGLSFERLVASIVKELSRAVWREYLDRSYRFRADGSLVF